MNRNSFAHPSTSANETIKNAWEQRPEMRALRSEAGEVARLFAIAGRMSLQNPEQLAHLRSIIERTRKELTDLIYGTGSQQGQSSTTGGSSSESPTIDQA